MPRQPAFPPKLNLALLIINLITLALALVNFQAEYEWVFPGVRKDFVSGTLFGSGLWGMGLSFYNVLAPFCTGGYKQEGGVRLGDEKS